MRLALSPNQTANKVARGGRRERDCPAALETSIEASRSGNLASASLQSGLGSWLQLRTPLNSWIWPIRGTRRPYSSAPSRILTFEAIRMKGR